MGKKTESLSKEYKFPKKAWLASILLTAYDGQDIFYFLERVYKNKREVLKGVQILIKKLIKRNGKEAVHENIILIPVNFSSLFLLKKEYWDDPFYEESPINRTISFTTAAIHPYQYCLVVTVTEILNKPGKVMLTTAFVYKKTDDAYLETMIKATHHPASYMYKYAAIYSIGENVVYNTQTKKYLKNDQTSEISTKDKIDFIKSKAIKAD